MVRISVAPYGISVNAEFEAVSRTTNPTGAKDVAKTPCPGSGSVTTLFWKLKLVSLLILSSGNTPVVFRVISQVNLGVNSACGKRPLALHLVSKCTVDGTAYEYSRGPAQNQNGSSIWNSYPMTWQYTDSRWQCQGHSFPYHDALRCRCHDRFRFACGSQVVPSSASAVSLQLARPPSHSARLSETNHQVRTDRP